MLIRVICGEGKPNNHEDTNHTIKKSGFHLKELLKLIFQAEPFTLCRNFFAISGPTGAGKSTILDALCLALYDKTPRFSASVESLYMSDIGESRVNQADVKNILRRGTGEGFAEVDFLGASGHCYRSRWCGTPDQEAGLTVLCGRRRYK